MYMDQKQIETIKAQYPEGTRIMLDHMSEDPDPVPDGTKGTVIAVDSLGTVHCEFDNGRSLGLCPEVDKFHKIEND